MGDMVRIGRVMGCVPDAHMAMEQLRGNEMHFAVLPLVHPRARREFRQKTSREEPFTRSDLTPFVGEHPLHSVACTVSPKRTQDTSWPVLLYCRACF